MALLLVPPVFLVVTTTCLQAWVVPSDTMAPALHRGDRVLLDVTSAGQAARGDVVVVDLTGRAVTAGPARGNGLLATVGRRLSRMLGARAGEQDAVRRVVAVAGDHLTCCDDAGRLVLNGRPLDERYLGRRVAPSPTRFDVTVPPGRVWLMADARTGALDSRTFGPDPTDGTVTLERVVGRVRGVYWPPGHLRSVG